MSDKSPTGVGPVFALPDHAVITFQGRDAIAFAQAQFMNDVVALGDGCWHWSGWLTPKGRIVALFALMRMDSETLSLVLADGGAEPMAERLRGFLFRSKVTISVRDDLKVGGRLAAPVDASAATLSASDNGRIELDMSGTGAPRSLLIGPGLETVVDDAAVARWRLQDLEHGLPRLVAGQSEQWTPQQLSLERLNAFSVKKGCYPGQEIVARTHFLGKAKRGLTLLEAKGPVAVDSNVSADGKSLGRVVASADAGQRRVALAVLPLERAEGALSSDDTPVSAATLKDGLAR